MNVNPRNIHGDTPMHCGFRKKMGVAVLKLILEAGADVHLRNLKGRTPLHEAAKYSAIGMPGIDMLISNGASVNVRDDKGYSILHDALKNRKAISLNILQKLLQYGANPDSRDYKNRPPLAYVESSSLSTAEKKYFTKLLIQCTVIGTSSHSSKAGKILCLSFCSKRSKRKEWASFRNSCIAELIQMRNEKVRDNYTLHKLVYQQLLERTNDANLDVIAIKKIISWLSKNKYPAFKDVIISAIQHFEFKVLLWNIQMYSAKLDNVDKSSVVLDSDCIYKLCLFLRNIDVINLILASFI